MDQDTRKQLIANIKTELAISDFDMARTVDDLILALIKSGVLSNRQLSGVTRAKLERRAHLREQLFELCQADLEENPVTQLTHDCSSCHHCHSTDAHLEQVQ